MVVSNTSCRESRLSPCQLVMKVGSIDELTLIELDELSIAEERLELLVGSALEDETLAFESSKSLVLSVQLVNIQQMMQIDAICFMARMLRKKGCQSRQGFVPKLWNRSRNRICTDGW